MRTQRNTNAIFSLLAFYVLSIERCPLQLLYWYLALLVHPTRTSSSFWLNARAFFILCRFFPFAEWETNSREFRWTIRTIDNFVLMENVDFLFWKLLVTCMPCIVGLFAEETFVKFDITIWDHTHFRWLHTLQIETMPGVKKLFWRWWQTAYNYNQHDWDTKTHHFSHLSYPVAYMPIKSFARICLSEVLAIFHFKSVVISSDKSETTSTWVSSLAWNRVNVYKFHSSSNTCARIQFQQFSIIIINSK